MAKATLAQQAFLNKIAPWVVYYAPQYGIKCPSAVIGQAVHETGWGKDGLSPYNNFFGMKCGTAWKGASVNKKTQEEYKVGTMTNISANFRAYATVEEGIKGYFEFISSSRYSNLKGITDPLKYLQTIKADGYATGSKYAENIYKTITGYGLDRYDKMEPVRPSYTKADAVEAIRGWIGRKESNGTHKAIVDVYNADLKVNVRQHGTVSYSVLYTDSWCAAAASAAYIYAGMDWAFPVECSCPRMITIAKKMGVWTEKDGYVPAPGDAILYDWQDSGAGDNTGTPDHIGIVEKVEGRTITVIEGNYSDSVKRRAIQVDGKGIRGYVVPRASAGAVQPQTGTSSTEVPKTPAPAAGAPKTTVLKEGVVTAHLLNVRTWAGTENKTCSFSPLRQGQKVGICDTVGAKDGTPWYYIKVGDKYGFVSSRYVRC